MVKITVFDNGGATLDRYRVCINNEVFSMSANASNSQGVNQFIGSYIKPDKCHRNAYGKKLPGIPACILSSVFQRALEATTA